MIPITITDVRAVPGDSAFLIDDGATAILYDSGFAFTGYQVADNIKSVLGDRSLDYILLTHSHYDHVLGTPYIVKAYPDAKVIAGVYAGQIFQKPSARAVMRELNAKAARKYGMAAGEDLIDSLKVDIAVADGDTIACGALQFTVVTLPGHTKCSVGYYLSENKLLLGTETLGVYFGDNTYLPSYLVGYRVTLDAFRKVDRLDIERILLPHYGVVEKEEAASYLERSQHISVETAQTIKELLLLGRSHEEIAAHLEKTLYKACVVPIYPIDAFRLNTDIMIELIRKELITSAKEEKL